MMKISMTWSDRRGDSNPLKLTGFEERDWVTRADFLRDALYAIEKEYEFVLAQGGKP